MRSLSARFDYNVVAIEERNDIFTLTFEGLMSSLCSHEQRMNKRINSTNLDQALQSRASTGGRGGQQGGRGHGRGGGRGGHNFNNEDEDPTQILLKKGLTLLSLKISHTYNVFDAKSMDIISQNVEQNCRMNKMSK
ncbi:hypothetical protein CK203_059853 [Vitis vinifera]|uniref:Uncharacterized protein n=1 Tax=Vitis vinifera TaxID=29760 RepID=A0A438GG31_VITVI|nr:hypothetical protein CK203_059853 [Vitis vinifera]